MKSMQASNTLDGCLTFTDFASVALLTSKSGAHIAHSPDSNFGGNFDYTYLIANISEIKNTLPTYNQNGIIRLVSPNDNGSDSNDDGGSEYDPDNDSSGPHGEDRPIGDPQPSTSGSDGEDRPIGDPDDSSLTSDK